MGWESSNWWVFGGLLPTVLLFVLLVGVKTEYRWPTDLEN